MYCKNCGTKIPEKAAFCPNCGTAAAAPPPIPPQKQPDSGQKKRRLPILLGIAAVAAVAVIVLAVTLFSGGTGDAMFSNIPIFARYDEDGNAFLPLMDGTCVKIEGEISSAAITPDRKHILVLDQDGRLYVTDPGQSQKTVVADGVSSFIVPKDDGFLYRDEDDVYFRYRFRSGESVELGEVRPVVAASNCITVLYLCDDGDIRMLPSDSDESVKLGTERDSVILTGISDDGELAAWVDNGTLYLSSGGERTKLGDLNGSSYAFAFFTADQKVLVLTAYSSEYLWIVRRGEEPEKVKLGGTLGFSGIYTPNGILNGSTSKQAEDLYVFVRGRSDVDVCHISPEGDLETVVSGIKYAQIAGGNLVYQDEDSSLYCARLNGAETEDETRLAKNVPSFAVSTNGQYVYYTKRSNTGDWSLYGMKLGTDSPEKISSDIQGVENISISKDGKTVYYFTDIEKIGSTSSSQGTLMMWTYGSDDSVRIAGDVSLKSLTSGIQVSYSVKTDIDPDHMWLLKVTGYSSDEIYGDWLFFNGKKTTTLASDVFTSPVRNTRSTPSDAPAPAATEAPVATEAPAAEDTRPAGS